MHEAMGPPPVPPFRRDNSNFAADIDESSIRAGIINHEPATYVLPACSLPKLRRRVQVIGQASSSHAILSSRIIVLYIVD